MIRTERRASVRKERVCAARVMCEQVCGVGCERPGPVKCSREFDRSTVNAQL
jgi:hypothetical protein